MTVKHVSELFVLDGRDFITEAYRNLYRREADDHGLMYYLGRMAQGHSKADIIAQLAKSPECRRLDEIAGLKRITVDAKRSKNWLWRWFSRNKNLELVINSGMYRIDAQIACTNKHVASLQETLHLLATNQARQVDKLVQEIKQIRIITHDPDQQHDKPQQLSPEIVSQVFSTILGREPENMEVVNHFAKLESPQALCEALIHSDEFQSKLTVQSEYARFIYLHQIQQQKVATGV